MGFYQLLLFCRRFLTPLVSLHTFDRPSIGRKCMNSQKADLSTPVSQQRVIASTVSQCLFYSLQGYSSTVTVTVVYTPRLFTRPTVPAKLHSIASRVFLRMHLETCIGLSQRHVVRWEPYSFPEWPKWLAALASFQDTSPYFPSHHHTSFFKLSYLPLSLHGDKCHISNPIINRNNVLYLYIFIIHILYYLYNYHLNSFF